MVEDIQITRQEEGPVSYFSISKLRMYFMSILSGGLYEIYWMYRNWKAVKLAKNDKSMPMFRSFFFGLFWIIPLFMQIGKDVAKHKPVSTMFKVCGALYFLAFVVLMIVFRVDAGFSVIPVEITHYVSGGGLIFYLLSPVFLFPIQNAINFHNQQNNPEAKTETTYAVGELVTLIIGFIAIASGFVVGFNEGYKMQKQEEAVGFMVGSAFRNVTVFDGVCNTVGYDMLDYPGEYMNMFSKEFILFEHKLEELQLSVEQVYKMFLTPEVVKATEQSVVVSIDILRKKIIMVQVAKEQNVDVATLVWDDKYNDMLSFAQTCEIIDKNPVVYIEKETNLIQSMGYYTQYLQ